MKVGQSIYLRLIFLQEETSFPEQERHTGFRKSKTAERYRRHTERHACTETWLVSFQIPKSLLHSLQQEQLRFSANHKEYVWLCTGETKILIEFHVLIKSDLTKVYICSSVPKTMVRTKYGDV